MLRAGGDGCRGELGAWGSRKRLLRGRRGRPEAGLGRHSGLALTGRDCLRAGLCLALQLADLLRDRLQLVDVGLESLLVGTREGRRQVLFPVLEPGLGNLKRLQVALRRRLRPALAL